uniref:DNA-binding transcriptional response regulator, NtrC family, contains REC, AAA-type ATPase, and a Fis-type DNA-binding domains n=1 Tax=Candidatus Kentrum sp. SD TaxID=2126332 RepID=A0A451BLI3_9GAMM|nr:MAG: DNA-binding transcriptional response regulator, NtrC family, contains REC, AAA-type ATPase, and a Fis-type DNA-binding domains [Candidatus Kentron sp. SD]VFK48358.1 MAG: DNA-binding transcriptional response regulator, NtrC family, contains REC, AAA-type ATPase, and a Fis-type DNA-binding domains [Candidatus Kentron sp. SD]VFK79165.1 MAG: DNA-binding transcriptional response regulator, NtrC family, contains REC, AAA-type ATPase, and a Fis-type DNA-binding domains [Candidatus Kentron sp. SD
MAAPHILVVDDEPDIRQLLKDILEDEDYEVSVAENAESARQARRARRPDLILLDIWMPDTDGISLLKEWSESTGLDTPVIMMSGHGTVETAVEATRLGAYDYIEKPLSMAKLFLAVRRALEASKLRQENVELRQEIIPVGEPVGRSSLMQALRDQIKRVAQHDTPVLITGESGSGKEVAARYLHGLGNRASGPFVRATVAGMAGDNPPVEIFGSEDGDKIHFGSLELANGGTLFLEDIADMEPELQARLLGALRHQSFQRVDGVAPVRINVRIVAATSRDLPTEVQEGRFREDLYYHLNVVPVRVPPLRKHREDVPELLSFYMNLLVSKDNLPYRNFSFASQNRLRNYDWPGNIRELKNVTQRLLILSNGQEIDEAEVEAALGNAPTRAEAFARPAEFDLPLKEAREHFERAYLEHQILKANGSISRVAAKTGIERTHLYRKLRALGIDAKQIMEKKLGS